VAGDWRRMHTEELHNLYTSYILRCSSQDEMGRTCNIHGRNEYRSWLENVKGRDHSEDLGINGRILE
jgi:hypothetical protein